MSWYYPRKEPIQSPPAGLWGPSQSKRWPDAILQSAWWCIHQFKNETCPSEITMYYLFMMKVFETHSNLHDLQWNISVKHELDERWYLPTDHKVYQLPCDPVFPCNYSHFRTPSKEKPYSRSLWMYGCRYPRRAKYLDVVESTRLMLLE